MWMYFESNHYIYFLFFFILWQQKNPMGYKYPWLVITGPSIWHTIHKPKKKKHRTTTHSRAGKAHTAQSNVHHVSCRHQQNHAGVQTGSVYQLEQAQGTLEEGPSIPPLSTSTLISSLLVQKAVRAPSSAAVKTPQPENIPLKKRPHLSDMSVHLLTPDISVSRTHPLSSTVHSLWQWS